MTCRDHTPNPATELSASPRTVLAAKTQTRHYPNILPKQRHEPGSWRSRQRRRQRRRQLARRYRAMLRAQLTIRQLDTDP